MQFEFTKQIYIIIKYEKTSFFFLYKYCLHLIINKIKLSVFNNNFRAHVADSELGKIDYFLNRIL